MQLTQSTAIEAAYFAGESYAGMLTDLITAPLSANCTCTTSPGVPLPKTGPDLPLARTALLLHIVCSVKARTAAAPRLTFVNAMCSTGAGSACQLRSREQVDAALADRREKAETTSCHNFESGMGCSACMNHKSARKYDNFQTAFISSAGFTFANSTAYTAVRAPSTDFITASAARTFRKAQASFAALANIVREQSSPATQADVAAEGAGDGAVRSKSCNQSARYREKICMFHPSSFVIVIARRRLCGRNTRSSAPNVHRHQDAVRSQESCQTVEVQSFDKHQKWRARNKMQLYLQKCKASWQQSSTAD